MTENLGIHDRAAQPDPAAREVRRMSPSLVEARLRPGAPDFLDLPWDVPLDGWRTLSPRLVELERGVSRHEVQFVAYDAGIYAIKQTSAAAAEREYEALLRTEERRLPCVRAAGWLALRAPHDAEGGVLITEFLSGSLPFRTLFGASGLERYRDRLLDAMASLLVRLHLGGVFWGDCSLSNTLFRRDAGELSTYLVDAETAEIHASLSDGQRAMDLAILEENVAGELADLEASGQPLHPLNPWDTGGVCRQRYEQLWREVTREELLTPGEGWRIQERIRALNALGFSVGEVELVAEAEGSRLRLRTIVTDRDYHRHQLHDLTGLSLEEQQARLILNEIRELRAQLSSERNQSVPLSVAAYQWRRTCFEPALARLAPPIPISGDGAELYCQVLEHKWYLSESARRDVGREAAIDDYLRRFGTA